MKQLLTLIIALTLAQGAFGQSHEIATYISDYVKEHHFNGSILIQQTHKTTYHHSFGVADRQFNIPTNNGTKYKIASVTKLFTAVLVLQLYEEGKLDLNKTIGTYLPDYTGVGRDKVTIHHLLNHTSGLTNMDAGLSKESAIKSGIDQYQKPYTTDELLRKFCSGKLEHEPGKVFDYNNGEYIILGKIIERIYGKSYEQVLKQRLLQPLRMDDSGFLHQQDVVERLANTYMMSDDLKVLVNDLPVYIENWYAAGAMYSTTTDLLKFSESLFGFKLTRKETVKLMVQPGLDDYGYSVWAYEVEINNKQHKAIKRPGRIMGAQAMLFHFLDDDLSIIILSNTDTTDLDSFVLEIGKRLIKERVSSH